jgi:hypothetical protein
MRKIAIIFTFLIYCLQAEAQISTQNKNLFQLEAKMISGLDKGAGCGRFKLATVLEFQIIKFSDKTYKMRNIGIVIRCAEFYGKDFFEVGKTYKLNVEIEKEKKTGDNFDYTIQNMRTLEKYKTENIFWAISISKK